jgi:hypothetical protein
MAGSAQHRLERRLETASMIRDAIAAARVGDRPHCDHHAGLDLGVQYSRWARMSWASSDVISEMNVGRGGLSLQK